MKSIFQSWIYFKLQNIYFGSIYTGQRIFKYDSIFKKYYFFFILLDIYRLFFFCAIIWKKNQVIRLNPLNK